MHFMLPIPGFVSVVCLAVLWHAGDGIAFTPGDALGCVNLALLRFGKLSVGNGFFH